jgi:uncharacterized protein (TIGR03792 family)
MLIERLHFQVAPSKIEKFLDADSRIWTSWLQRQPGFINKQYITYSIGQVTMLLFWKSPQHMERALARPDYPTIEPIMRAELGEVYRLTSSS